MRLRDAYWDTPARDLGRAGCTLRVRELDGRPDGELTFKGRPVRGARTEETATVPTGTGPAHWRRVRAARPIVDALRERGLLDALRPDVVLVNPRVELALRRGRAEEVVSLDEVRIEGEPYVKRYVEVELKHGARTRHDALVRALSERFGLKESKQGKLPAAREWLERRQARSRAAAPGRE